MPGICCHCYYSFEKYQLKIIYKLRACIIINIVQIPRGSINRIVSEDIKRKINMRAKSIIGKSSDEIQLALQQSMGDGFKPTLSIVFVSIKQDRSAIREI